MTPLPLVPATTPGVTGTAQFTSNDLVPSSATTGSGPDAGHPQPRRSRPPERHTQQTIISLNASYQLNDDMTLRSITGYVHTQDFFSTDFSGLGVVIWRQQCQC